MNRSFLCLVFGTIIVLLNAIDCQTVCASQAQSNTHRKIKTGNAQKKAQVAPLPNNIQVDDKITDQEKKEYNAAVEQSNQYAAEQAVALNKVPGVAVSADDLKEKQKEGPSLNPIKWLFGPVIRLQEQSVVLEQQIMKLTGPIAALQPGMLGLEHRMTSMQNQLTNVEKTTGSVENELLNIRQDIASMHATLSEIKKPVTDIKEPIMSLRDPILKIAKPITGVDRDLQEVKTLLSLVLTSIFVAALIISIGTPVAAILVWRNRQNLLPKPDAKQQHEEEKIKQATKTMDHQLRS